MIAEFEAAWIPYALCGGLALAVHRFPRATLDIDLLHQTPGGWRVNKTDMSATAVTRRLRQVCELRKLCLSLAKAEKVSSDAKTIPGFGKHGRANLPVSRAKGKVER